MAPVQRRKSLVQLQVRIYSDAAEGQVSVVFAGPVDER